MRQVLRFVLFRSLAASQLLLILLALSPRDLAQGLATSDLPKLRSVGAVALSPDGRHLAYTVTMFDEPGRPYGQLWIMDLTTQKSVRIGGDKDRGGGPVWSPDGKSLAFTGKQGDKRGLMIAKRIELCARVRHGPWGASEVTTHSPLWSGTSTIATFWSEMQSDERSTNNGAA